MPKKASKSKSIWRSADAQHFQLVHRSQRDPLINDPEAGAHVLKSFDPANQARRTGKGKTRAQLEEDTSVAFDKLGRPVRSNVGEAANYGIYFDDTEYDYMQHLRPIHDDENLKRGGENVDEEIDTILISASKQKPKSSTKDGGFSLKPGGDDNDNNNNNQIASSSAGPSSSSGGTKSAGLQLPASVLPSQKEMPFSYTSHLNVEPSLQGFQPDMDPHLRQALEALDDEAFVDDELDDDFFGEVVRDGTWDGVVRDEDRWRDQAPEGDEAIWADPALRAQRELEEVGEENMSLEARVALFKKQQEAARSEALSSAKGKGKGKGRRADDGDDDDEGRDELRSLRAGSQAGTMYTAGGSVLGKKGKPGALARRAASTKAPSIGGGSTAWSMSSSAMFRNKGLSDLDDRFAKIGRDYGIRDEDDDFDDELDALEEEQEFEDDEGGMVDSDGEESGQVVTREDFEGIMDEFLEKYDVKHGKMQESLGGVDATPLQKLTLLREAMGRARIDGKEWAGKGVDEGKGSGSLGDYEDYDSPDEDLVDPVPRSHAREKWDVETIQTTKTNVENHPRTISAGESVFGGISNSNASGSVFRPKGLGMDGSSGAKRGAGMLGAGMAPSMTSFTSQRPSAAAFLNSEDRLPKIRINPRTGFPEIVGYTKPAAPRGSKAAHANGNGSLVEDDGRGPPAADSTGDRDGDSDTEGSGSGSGSDTDRAQDSDADSDATESGNAPTLPSIVAKRDRNESKQDRKARKEAVKLNKRQRKSRKAQTKAAFASEKSRQNKAESGRKLAEGSGPASAMRLL
ncbi:hypothetical protein BCV70DRAFT_202740 [Testicularia cyperi]|uniref:LTV-domain-containing protein n=1 Tax=Testicularia cyperi TaxID=1882483 RepID=A0A317XGV3_9BASI|nr:hypothetical protein BCV70DRAFT_202740 [Testicularia cyperi]